VQFRWIGMLMAPDRSYRTELVKAILDANDRYKIAKFGLDTDDGEVAAYIDLILADGTVTAGQLRRCMGVLLTVVLPVRRRLAAIVRTGRDPGPVGISRDRAAAAGRLLELLRAAAESKSKPDDGPGARPPASKGPTPVSQKSGPRTSFDDLLDAELYNSSTHYGDE